MRMCHFSKRFAPQGTGDARLAMAKSNHHSSAEAGRNTHVGLEREEAEDERGSLARDTTALWGILACVGHMWCV